MVRLQLPPAPPISLGLMDKWITGLLSITRAAVFSSIHSSINPQIHWFRVCMVSSIHSSTNPQIHFVGLPGRLISRTPPFEGEDGGASPSPAANLRSVVKQDHVWPTPRNRRGSTFPGDHLPLSVEVCTPVSETGRAGALPAAATNFSEPISTKSKHLTAHGRSLSALL